MLYGLKHMGKDIDTIILLDSNGRDMKGEDVGDRVHIRSLGGLCVAATAMALNEVKLVFTQVKRFVVGLGTNDHLHSQEHPGDIVTYLRELEMAVKKPTVEL